MAYKLLLLLIPGKSGKKGTVFENYFLFSEKSALEQELMDKKSKRRKSKSRLRNKMHELIDGMIQQVAAENEGERLLLRDLRAEALARIEQSAKTEADFEIVLNAWNLIDLNNQKKDEEYTISLYNYKMDADTGEFSEIDEVICTDTVFPIPYSSTLRSRYWRQIISGDFLDYIYDCAYEMHNYASSKHVSRAINRLTDNQKEIFYMIVIEGKSARQIAAYRNQTPRNINKIYAGALKSIHKYLKPYLKSKSESNTNDNNKDYMKGKSEK
jgi:hypothetical protein